MLKVWTCHKHATGWLVMDERRIIASVDAGDDAKRICELHRIFQEFHHTPGLDMTEAALRAVEMLVAEAHR